ncbi:MAG: hypothetical protein QME79_14665 [Bacillota bacterium]|nr:hypothetical protein [Bacillota bacterium]
MAQYLLTVTYRRNPDGTLTRLGQRRSRPIPDRPDYWDPICDAVIGQARKGGETDVLVTAPSKGETRAAC